jgi:hypothetical protein
VIVIAFAMAPCESFSLSQIRILWHLIAMAATPQMLLLMRAIAGATSSVKLALVVHADCTQVDDLKFALHLEPYQGELQGQNTAYNARDAAWLFKWRWEGGDAVVRKDQGVVLKPRGSGGSIPTSLVVPRPFVLAHHPDLQGQVSVQLLVKVPPGAVQQAKTSIMQSRSTAVGARRVGSAAEGGGGSGEEGIGARTYAACGIGVGRGAAAFLRAEGTGGEDGSSGGGGGVADSIDAPPFGGNSDGVAALARRENAAAIETTVGAAAEEGPSGRDVADEGRVVATFKGKLTCHNKPLDKQYVAYITNLDGKLGPFVNWRFVKLEHVAAKVRS